MNKEIIKLSKISKKFLSPDKNISVLKNINLKINKGELVSLVGPSGSGKSTLLHIIALLDQPSSGEIFFKSKNFSRSSDSEKDIVRKKGISVIYQQNILLSDFTALENVIIPLLNNGIGINDATKKATVTTYYENTVKVDDYVMDIIKQGGIFNTISFDEEAAAGTFASAWFPLESQCPDADHYIHAYIVDTWGDVTWENKPTGKSS